MPPSQPPRSRTPEEWLTLTYSQNRPERVHAFESLADANDSRVPRMLINVLRSESCHPYPQDVRDAIYRIATNQRHPQRDVLVRELGEHVQHMGRTENEMFATGILAGVGTKQAFRWLTGKYKLLDPDSRSHALSIIELNPINPHALGFLEQLVSDSRTHGPQSRAMNVVLANVDSNPDAIRVAGKGLGLLARGSSDHRNAMETLKRTNHPNVLDALLNSAQTAQKFGWDARDRDEGAQYYLSEFIDAFHRLDRDEATRHHPTVQAIDVLQNHLRRDVMQWEKPDTVHAALQAARGKKPLEQTHAALGVLFRAFQRDAHGLVKEQPQVVRRAVESAFRPQAVRGFLKGNAALFLQQLRNAGQRQAVK